MLIVKKNFLSVREKLINEAGQLSLDYMRTGYDKYMFKVEENRLILDLYTSGQIFIGKCDWTLLNLTDYYIYKNLHGMSDEEVYNRSLEHVVNTIDDEGNHKSFMRPNYLDVYVNTFRSQDPWGKKRMCFNTHELQGFNIINVSPKKKAVIATFFVYTGYDILMSRVMQFTLYGDKWYMRKPDGDAWFEGIEGNINLFYKELNY